LTPQTAAEGDEVFRGERVLWGGTVVSVTNMEKRTQLEILAFPLGRGQRPDTDAQARGRFLAVADDFLDPADYAAGREVTVTGSLKPVKQGRIGELDYTYPVVSVTDIQLWPRRDASGRSGDSGVRFGFGVIIHN
jgi:outer membrane lipoprotein